MKRVKQGLKKIEYGKEVLSLEAEIAAVSMEKTVMAQGLIQKPAEGAAGAAAAVQGDFLLALMAAITQQQSGAPLAPGQCGPEQAGLNVNGLFPAVCPEAGAESPDTTGPGGDSRAEGCSRELPAGLGGAVPGLPFLIAQPVPVQAQAADQVPPAGTGGADPEPALAQVPPAAGSGPREEILWPVDPKQAEAADRPGPGVAPDPAGGARQVALKVEVEAKALPDPGKGLPIQPGNEIFGQGGAAQKTAAAGTGDGEVLIQGPSPPAEIAAVNETGPAKAAGVPAETLARTPTGRAEAAGPGQREAPPAEVQQHPARSAVAAAGPGQKEAPPADAQEHPARSAIVTAGPKEAAGVPAETLTRIVPGQAEAAGKEAGGDQAGPGQREASQAELQEHPARSAVIAAGPKEAAGAGEKLPAEVAEAGPTGADVAAARKDAQGPQKAPDPDPGRAAVRAERQAGGPAGEKGEIPNHAAKAVHQGAAISPTVPLASITPGKFPAVVLPHLVIPIRNMNPDQGRVTVINMKLEPENLGEIKIRLSYAKGELTAHFFTSSGLVRDAVEYSLPQLKEALAQYNISLGEAAAYVGQDQKGHRWTGPGGSGSGRGEVFAGGSVDSPGEAVNPAHAGERHSILDLFI